MHLSLLDLIPVRHEQTSAQAVAASLTLAKTAEAAGFTRVWYAEHHNVPAVASTSPAVLIAAALAATTRIRVGSGGVMLPNHAPLTVAEQFAVLEALAPGRVDLGIGRAPGSDPVVSALLRSSGPTADVERFPEHIVAILAMLQPEGAPYTLAGGTEYRVTATPAAAGAPTVWLLGSSDYSAELAARLGLPYVFANHFGGGGLERALEVYRSQYRPSAAHPEPRTILTLTAVAAPSRAEALELALPQRRLMATLRAGRPLGPLETVEQALAAQRAGDPDDPALAAAAEAPLPSGWIVDEADAAAAAIAELAARHGIEEVMLAASAGARDADPLDAVPAREQTLRLLGERLLGGRPLGERPLG